VYRLELGPADEPIPEDELKVPELLEPMVLAVEADLSLATQLQGLVDAATGLAPAERAELSALLQQEANAFAATPDDYGPSSAMPMTIDVGAAAPIRRSPYRLAPPELKVVEAEVKKMLAQGVIVRSTSPWSSPVLLVSKPDGSTRFVVDFRGVNRLTAPQSQQIPRIDDLLTSFSGGQYFSSLDVMSAFWQVKLEPLRNYGILCSWSPLRVSKSSIRSDECPSTLSTRHVYAFRGLDWARPLGLPGRRVHRKRNLG
jgi:hypothetical protein